MTRNRYCPPSPLPKVSAIIHKRVSFVLCTADAVKHRTQKVRKALKHGIPLVSQVCGLGRVGEGMKGKGLAHIAQAIDLHFMI